jgi:hypothetical protein
LFSSYSNSSDSEQRMADPMEEIMAKNNGVRLGILQKDVD